MELCASSSEESSDEEEDDTEGVERPVFAVGDYVVYQAVEKGAGPPNQWTQGRIVKVKDKKKKVSKKKASRKKFVKLYCIQPLDAKQGELVKVPDAGKNRIASDLIGGAIQKFHEGDRVLFLVDENFQKGIEAVTDTEKSISDCSPFWAEAR